MKESIQQLHSHQHRQTDMHEIHRLKANAKYTNVKYMQQ